MIVKNNTQHHHSQKQQPLFMQGFQYARQLLVQLKKQKEKQIKQKQKQKDLDYSPITRKHTKLSSDIVIEQQPYLYHNSRSQRKGSKGTKLRQKQRDQRKTQNVRSDTFASYEEVEQWGKTTKHKLQDISTSSQQDPTIISKTFPKQSMLQSQTDPQINDHPNPNLMHSSVMPLPVVINPILSQIHTSHIQINRLGTQLHQTYSQLQTYQIIFQNLCDCYRANSTTINKNNNLKKQALRLQQQKLNIIQKIQYIRKEEVQLEKMEKLANQYIREVVDGYVRQVCAYNSDYNREQIMGKQDLDKIQNKYEIIDQDNDQETYDTSLNLNYKKLKQRYDERIKKKGLMQPKKLQKGVSFQQQIDVISKYYESQMSNI